MKKQNRTVGAFVSIELTTGFFAYARILNEASFAFYDFLTEKRILDIELIKDKPVLFIVSVYNDAVTKGRWLKIGKLPLEERLQIVPTQYIQDSINPDQFSLYDPNSGDIIPSSRNRCVGLEAAAVWEAEHVESRIEDYYANRPNRWVEMLTLGGA